LGEENKLKSATLKAKIHHAGVEKGMSWFCRTLRNSPLAAVQTALVLIGLFLSANILSPMIDIGVPRRETAGTPAFVMG
jgi:hypothetical protein